MTGGDSFREGSSAATARRRRSLAIAAALVAFVALVFSITVVRIGQNRDAASAPASTTARGVDG